MQWYSRIYSSSMCSRLLRLALVVGWWCVALPPAPIASAAEATTLSTVATVLDPATLDVELPGGAVQTIRLTGIAAYATDDQACGSAQAVARIDQLVADQSVTVEMLAALDPNAQPAPAYVWLPGGDNLAQVLVREGSAPGRNRGSPPTAGCVQFGAGRRHRRSSRDLGARRVPPRAGAAAAQGSVDRGGLAAYLTSASDAILRARLGVSVLRDQSRSAPLVASTPGWQATTTTALGWLGQSVQVFQAPAPGGGPAGPVHAQLLQLGEDLQHQMDGYASAATAGDVNGLQAASTQLSQTADALSPVLAEVNAIGSAYGLGD